MVPHGAPVALYLPPAFEHQGPGLRHMRSEVRALDAPALRWDLLRVRRALAAFTPAEIEDGGVTRRNPQVLVCGAYPVLHSDYLQEREWCILRELRERGEEVES